MGIKLKDIELSIQPGMTIHSYVDGARKEYGKVGAPFGEAAYKLEGNPSFCAVEFSCAEDPKEPHLLFCSYKGDGKEKVREIDAGVVLEVKKDGKDVSLKVLDMVDTKGKKYYQTYQFNL